MSAAFPLLTPNLNTGGPLGSERTPMVAHQIVSHRSFVTLPIVDAPKRISPP